LIEDHDFVETSKQEKKAQITYQKKRAARLSIEQSFTYNPDNAKERTNLSTVIDEQY